MTDIVERLSGHCIDYDGSPIPDGAEPMDGLHCDVLYAAMNEILSLRSRAEKAEAQAATSHAAWKVCNDARNASRLRAEAAEAERDEALAKVLSKQIEQDRYFLLKADRAEATCEKLAKALEKIAEKGIGWSNYVRTDRSKPFITDGEIARDALATYRKEVPDANG